MPTEGIRPLACDGAGLVDGRSGDLVRSGLRDGMFGAARSRACGWVLFGGKRLPEIGRSLGRGMCGFKESLTGDEPHEEPEADGLPVLVQASADAEHDRTA